MQELTHPETSRTAGAGWKIFMGAAAILSLAAVNGFLFWRTSQLETEVARLRSSAGAGISDALNRTSAAAAETRKSLDEITKRIENSQAGTQRQAASLAKASGDRAVKHAENLVSDLATQHKAAREQMANELGAMKQSAEAAGAKAGEVAAEVGGVKTELASTRSVLDSAIADLRSVRGDLGVQSGLIATNARELAALRELGERNYFEFTISRTNLMTRVGGVSLVLKKADHKKNKFNLDVVADDKRVEKKDRGLNEPVQFYVSGSRLPYEIVVNQVARNRISGYLATPKLMQARR